MVRSDLTTTDDPSYFTSRPVCCCVREEHEHASSPANSRPSPSSSLRTGNGGSAHAYGRWVCRKKRSGKSFCTVQYFFPLFFISFISSNRVLSTLTHLLITILFFLLQQLDAKTKVFGIGIKKALDMVNGDCTDVLDASSALFLLMTSYRSCSPRSKKVGIALRTAISSLATKVIKLKTPKDCAQLTDAASVAAVTPISDLPQTILCNGLKSADLKAVVAASGPEDYKKMMTGAFLF